MKKTCQEVKNNPLVLEKASIVISLKYKGKRNAVEVTINPTGLNFTQEQGIVRKYNLVETGTTPATYPSGQSRGIIKFWNGMKHFDDFIPEIMERV